MSRRRNTQNKRVQAQPPNELLRAAVSVFTGFVVLVAITAVVLAFYGPALEDTITYRNLSEIIPPVVNIEIIGSLGAAVLALFTQAFVTGAKANAFDYMAKSGKIRGFVIAISVIIFALAIVLVLAGHFASQAGDHHFNSIVSEGIDFVTAAGLSTLSIALMYLAILPRRWHAAIPVNVLTRIAAFIGAVLFLILFLLSIEAGSGPKQEILPSGQGGKPASSHSISAILEGLHSRMASVSSNAVTLKFRLTLFNPNETAPRYPVSLDTTKQYSVSASIEGTGFDVSSLPEALSKPRPAVVDELLSWTWIVSPKPDRAGSRQLLLVRVFLHEKASGQMVYEAPIVTHVVEVRTPLGLPAWALSPTVTIGAVVVALLSLIANFLLPRLWPKAKGG